MCVFIRPILKGTEGRRQYAFRIFSLTLPNNATYAFGMNITRHPTVELRFRSIVSQGVRVPMIQVTDVTTGEVLMVELMKRTAEWLSTMGYEWLEGSPAIWQLKDRGGNAA